jgi:hypothetical protein
MGRALNVIGVPTSASMFTAAIEGLTSLDEAILRANPDLPRLAASGVVYSKADTDKWRTITDVLEGRNGPAMAADCEALGPWLAAERRVYDGDAAAQALIYPSGSNKFHCVVMRGDGTIEDPSVTLGMKAPPSLLEGYAFWNSQVAPNVTQPGPGDSAVLGFDDDVACIGVFEDAGGGSEITFEVERTPEGFRGRFRLPFIDGRALYGSTSTAASPEQAEQKATNVLGLVGSLWDDVAALVPGSSQAQAAIRIARNQHVQNLAKAAFDKAKGFGGHHGGGNGPAPAPARAVVPAYGGGSDNNGSGGGFWSRDPGGSDPLYDGDQDYADDPTIDGFHHGGGHHKHQREQAIVGYINATLAAGSKPTVGISLSAMRGGSSKATTTAPRAATTLPGMAPGMHAAPLAPAAASPYVNPATGQPYAASPYYAPNAYGPAGSLPAYGQQPPAYLNQQQRQGWLQQLAQQMVQQQAGGSGGGGGGDYGPAAPSYAPSYGGEDPSTPGYAIDQFYGGYNMPDADFDQTAALAQEINQAEGGEYGINGMGDADAFHGGGAEASL